MTKTLLRIPAALAVCAVVWLTATDAVALPFTLRCDTGGDAFGWTVGSQGDFDGDGIDDILIGNPCAVVGYGLNAKPRAGLVRVLSGKDGRRLYQRRGKQLDEFLGLGVSFVPDLNGDGRDEIAIGSPGCDLKAEQNPDPLGGPLLNAGKVILVATPGRVRFTILGTQPEGALGETVEGIADVNGDGVADIVVGASNERADRDTRPGRVHVYSGRNGALISTVSGDKGGEKFGSALATSPDINGDGIDDVIIGAPERNDNLVRDSGFVAVMRGDLSGGPILEETGARKDKLGKSVDSVGDRDGDGLSEFIVGSFNADDTSIRGAGAISIFSGDGVRLLASADPIPEENAHFGAAVASVGDVTGDGIADFAVGAPDNDSPAAADAGRIVTLSGDDASLVWSRDGLTAAQHLGFSLSRGPDINSDGVPDVVVGAIGTIFQKRRGAGTVTVLSGATGATLRTFGGSHGLETQIYSAGESDVVGFNVDGRPTTPRALLTASAGERPSLAVIDDKGVPTPGQVHLAVAAGKGGRDGTVTVFDAAQRDTVVEEFDALAGAVSVDDEPRPVRGGVNIASGTLGLDGTQDRIVAVQADSNDGNVLVRAFRRLDEQTGWFLESEFEAFDEADEFPLSPTVSTPIRATGASVAVGSVNGETVGDEIVVGALGPMPVVRVFTRNGTLLTQWLAYDPADSAGVHVCVADVVAGQSSEILTVPDSGTPLIKAFAGGGGRITVPETDEDVSIIPPEPVGFVGGGRACGADVDYDGVVEIVYVPGPSGSPLIQAFEVNGEPVLGFTSFEGPGAGLATTDRFVRR